VAVESGEMVVDGGAHAVDDDLGRRIGVLVDVELDGYVQVRRPVGFEADAVGAHWQRVDVSHAIILPRRPHRPGGGSRRETRQRTASAAVWHMRRQRTGTSRV